MISNKVICSSFFFDLMGVQVYFVTAPRIMNQAKTWMTSFHQLD